MNKKRMINIVLSIILILTAVSCMSKKSIAEKYIKQHPEFLAEHCSRTFPPSEKLVQGETKTDTVYKELPGVELPCPEVIDQDGKKSTPTVKCPPEKIVEILKVRTDTIKVVDEAKLFLRDSEIKELKEKVESLEKGKTWRNWIIGVFVIGIIIRKLV